MSRFALFGVATAALAIAAPAFAQDGADAERSFARAARSFTACLAATATGNEYTGSLDGKCLVQETAYRESGVRLRVARGLDADAAAKETEADIARGRESFGDARTVRVASSR
ncbi:hypothetical protein A6F68_00737 [Tsuneonella dongtanensis]|uniref:UrcA family protein n=1 Tax=Tsuneonella dongtanensis TaxID=692370 RepID=A0A1B2AAU6_9SPHN|nr:hypothetical protein [Tsuneonella dongtanensis]ANY19266.1 hypothetical protein A6F68_00737 [Tsuneonella dongtanensis]